MLCQIKALKKVLEATVYILAQKKKHKIYVMQLIMKAMSENPRKCLRFEKSLCDTKWSEMSHNLDDFKRISLTQFMRSNCMVLS